MCYTFGCLLEEQKTSRFKKGGIAFASFQSRFSNWGSTSCTTTDLYIRSTPRSDGAARRECFNARGIYIGFTPYPALVPCDEVVFLGGQTNY